MVNVAKLPSMHIETIHPATSREWKCMLTHHFPTISCMIIFSFILLIFLLYFPRFLKKYLIASTHISYILSKIHSLIQQVFTKCLYMPDTVSDAGDTSDQSPSSHRASIFKKNTQTANDYTESVKWW